MDIDTLNILADAISDVGAWNWWYIDDKLVQMEFRDIMLYDESKSCSTDVLAVRFKGHPFAVFLDNLHDDTWYERFRDNDSIIYPLDTYYLGFDDVNEAKKVMTDYRNIRPIKDFEGPETLSGAKHLISAGCGCHQPRCRDGSKGYCGHLPEPSSRQVGDEAVNTLIF